jgi:hypothetical protein
VSLDLSDGSDVEITLRPSCSEHYIGSIPLELYQDPTASSRVSSLVTDIDFNPKGLEHSVAGRLFIEQH